MTRKAVVDVLHAMSLDGWAMQSSGDVEAPTGWFATMHNEAADHDGVVDAFGELLASEGVSYDELIGSWWLHVDSDGNRTATSGPRYGVDDLWDSAEDTYVAWAAEAVR